MQDFRVLKFFDRFKNFFEASGIDYYLMRKILRIKLIMDGRRVPTVIGDTNSLKSKDNNNFLKSLWVYGIIGLAMLPFVIMGKNYIFQMSFAFGILMFMVMTSLISDFSSVLLDVRDRNIIFSKPIDTKTIGMAKLLHIVIYLFFVTISLSAVALVAALVKQGILFFIIFLFEIILMDLFIVVLTSMLYLVILRFFDGEKLKDIINYVQILLSIMIAVGYQFMGRLFDIVNVNAVFTPRWWQYLVVPVWFGAPFEVIINRHSGFQFLILSILSLIIPVISIIVYIKLMPLFERSLQKLNNNSGKTKNKNRRILSKTLNILCPNSDERTFFRFASNMIRNERDFKLKVYPSLGFSIIFPFIFLFNQSRNGGFQSIVSSKAYLTIYFCALMLPTVVMMIQCSGRHTGGWIYKIRPSREIAPIFKGTFKAVIIKLLLPVYMIDCIIFVVIFGVRIIPDLVLVFLNIILYTVICFKLIKKSIPFTESFDNMQSQGLIVIPLMAILGIMGFIHYKCLDFNFGLYIYLALTFIIDIIVWNRAFNISLEELKH